MVPPKTNSANRKANRYGFVSFEDPGSAKKAVDELNGQLIGGKTLYVSRAQNKAARESEKKKKFAQGVNLYVKNLDHTIDDERLQKEFSPYGTITSAIVMCDEKGRSKGFGFVCFSSPKAITEMNGRIIVVKPLYVGLAQIKEDRKAHLALQHQQRIAGQQRKRQSLAGKAPRPQQMAAMGLARPRGSIRPGAPRISAPPAARTKML